MAFGNKNLNRRVNRPDGIFYRERRRGKLDQATMLEIHRGYAPRKSGIVHRLAGLLRRLFKRS